MKLARVETSQSMDEFADALTKVLGVQVTRQRVNEWESGDRMPRATVLVAAARVAALPLDALFEGDIERRLAEFEKELKDLKRRLGDEPGLAPSE